MTGLATKARALLSAACLKRGLRRSVGCESVRTGIKVLKSVGRGHLDCALLHKADGRIWLSLARSSLVERYDEALSRLPVLLHVFSRSDLQRAPADYSDGESCGPGEIGFCANDPSAILIPDPFFFNSRGYRDVRRLGDTLVLPWAQRGDTILWCGSSTGKGVNTTDTMDPDDARLRLRVRLCLRLREVPGAEGRIVGIAQTDDILTDRARLDAADICGSRVPPESWFLRKFAIDVDGNTNAWTNLFTRLLMGCCVLKVESEQGFRQWYYEDLKPWTHFVPVRADLSDLAQTITWCRRHLRECAAIARAGQAFALEHSFERETERAVQRLNAARLA